MSNDIMAGALSRAAIMQACLDLGKQTFAPEWRNRSLLDAEAVVASFMSDGKPLFTEDGQKAILDRLVQRFPDGLEQLREELRMASSGSVALDETAKLLLASRLTAFKNEIVAGLADARAAEAAALVSSE